MLAGTVRGMGLVAVNRYLVERLSRWIAAGGAGPGAPEAVRIDPTAEEELRSLGYLD